VFSASVTWPDHSTGNRTGTPHAWASAVQFPFAAPWSYTGKQDLALDFVFRGGTLANQAAWTVMQPYYLDGVTDVTKVGGASTNYGTDNCTNAPHERAPFCVPVLYTYGRQTGDPKTANKFELQFWLHRYPPLAPVVMAMSPIGSATGVSIGTPCQKVHLVAGMMVAVFTTTPADNTLPFLFPEPKIYERFDLPAVGYQLWTQAAIGHPTRNRLEFTRAGAAPLLPQPKPVQGARWTLATNATATSGSGLNAIGLPVLRLAY